MFLHSAALYIKDERSRTPCYSFKDYLKALTKEGAQNRIEQALLKRGQDPYQHTRKQAISMAAKQMVSNNPNLYKVSFIFMPLHLLILFVIYCLDLQGSQWNKKN